MSSHKPTQSKGRGMSVKTSHVENKNEDVFPCTNQCASLCFWPEVSAARNSKAVAECWLQLLLKLKERQIKCKQFQNDNLFHQTTFSFVLCTNGTITSGQQKIFASLADICNWQGVTCQRRQLSIYLGKFQHKFLLALCYLRKSLTKVQHKQAEKQTRNFLQSSCLKFQDLCKLKKHLKQTKTQQNITTKTSALQCNKLKCFFGDHRGKK